MGETAATGDERRRAAGVLAWLVAGALLAGWLAGCRTDAVRPPNIVLIVVDTLRADHLGVYGYERDTSPNLDRLAERGILFERFYSVAPWTNPAMVTLFTGLYPQSVLPAAKHREAIRGALPRNLETLPEALRRRGYRTVALVDHPGLNRSLGFARGFDRFRFLFEEEGVEAWKINASTDFVARAFEASLDEPDGDGPDAAPFFVYLHLVYPHRPYLPQDEFLGFFGPGSWRNGLEYREGMINSYDAEIRQTDALLGRLLGALDTRGLTAETAIVFTSDHGEGFWEHGLDEHGKSFFDEEIRIPLLLVPPGGRDGAPARVATPASNVDLFPTLLELADVEPAHSVAGSSLSRLYAPASSGAATAAGDGVEWFFSESPHTRDIHAMAVLSTAGTKFVHAPGLGEELLFDLERDPGETTDLSATRDASAHRARLAEHRRRSRALRGALDTERVDVDDETLRRLEALGYVD